MTATDTHDTTSSARLEIDLLDPNFYQDGAGMHAAFSWMRANEPVYRDHRNGLWGITRHADLKDVERRSTVFLSSQGYRAIWASDEINMIAQDDPRHRQQRLLVQGDLTAAAVATRQPGIASLVAELLDTALASGEMEVIEALAGQLPARLTCQLLGYPESMWQEVKSWSERLMRIDMRERDGETFTEFVDANMEFVMALMPIAKERAGCPAHDLISTWVHAKIDDQPLPPSAIVHEVGLFISGGAETTRTAISHVARAGRGGGSAALGHAAQQHVPTRRRRHRSGRSSHPARRPHHHALPLRQSRRVGVRRPVHVRHPSQPEPADRVRFRHAHVRGHQRCAHHAGRGVPPVVAACHRPERDQRA